MSEAEQGMIDQPDVQCKFHTLQSRLSALGFDTQMQLPKLLHSHFQCVRRAQMQLFEALRCILLCQFLALHFELSPRTGVLGTCCRKTAYQQEDTIQP